MRNTNKEKKGKSRSFWRSSKVFESVSSIYLSWSILNTWRLSSHRYPSSYPYPHPYRFPISQSKITLKDRFSSLLQNTQKLYRKYSKKQQNLQSTNYKQVVEHGSSSPNIIMYGKEGFFAHIHKCLYTLTMEKQRDGLDSDSTFPLHQKPTIYTVN